MTRPQSKPPQPYEQFGQDFPSVIRAYEALGEACHESGPLDGKSRELVKLGIAIGAGLESATHAHARLAREAGATGPRQVARCRAPALAPAPAPVAPDVGRP